MEVQLNCLNAVKDKGSDSPGGIIGGQNVCFSLY